MLFSSLFLFPSSFSFSIKLEKRKRTQPNKKEKKKKKKKNQKIMTSLLELVEKEQSVEKVKYYLETNGNSELELRDRVDSQVREGGCVKKERERNGGWERGGEVVFCFVLFCFVFSVFFFFFFSWVIH